MTMGSSSSPSVSSSSLWSSPPLFFGLAELLSRLFSPLFSNNNRNNKIGRIWNGPQAAKALADQTLRTLEKNSNKAADDHDDDDDNNHDDKDKDSGHSKLKNRQRKQQQRRESDMGRPVRLCFRNLTKETILYSWINQEGKIHRFGAIFPTTPRGARGPVVTEADHIEQSFVGHAFVFTTLPMNRNKDNNNDGDDDNHDDQKEHSTPWKAMHDVDKVTVMGAYRPSHLTDNKMRSSLFHNTQRKSNDDSDDEEEAETACHVLTIRPRLMGPSDVQSALDCLLCADGGGWCPQQPSSSTAAATVTTATPKRSYLRKPKQAKHTHPNDDGTVKQQDRDNDDNDDDDDDDEEEEMCPWILTVCPGVVDRDPLDTSKKVYEECAFSLCDDDNHDYDDATDIAADNDDEKSKNSMKKPVAWPVRAEPNWYGGDETLRQRFCNDLKACMQCLPDHAVAALCAKKTRLWINNTLQYGPKAAPIRGRGMCFHPGGSWLKRQGMNVDKTGCIELYQAAEYKRDCNYWGPGGLLLHEFSHAYHYKCLPNGYDNAEIQSCYEQAMKDGLYNSVEMRRTPMNGEGRESEKEKRLAYAATNAMEYWAELSTAFLGGTPERNGGVEEFNKWFPFNRKQLRHHDPRAYGLLQKLWKVAIDDDEDDDETKD